jgi:glycerophosphoryl diester phosphodiesterase
MTLGQVRRLDAGSRFDPKFAGEKVPTVEEVLKLVAEYKRHEVLIAVDLKAEGVEGEVVRLAEKHEVLHRLLFIGRAISDPKVRERIKRASPKAHTAALANDAEECAKALAASGADWVYLRFLPTEEQMADVHERTCMIGGSEPTLLARRSLATFPATGGRRLGSESMAPTATPPGRRSRRSRRRPAS